MEDNSGGFTVVYDADMKQWKTTNSPTGDTNYCFKTYNNYH